MITIQYHRYLGTVGVNTHTIWSALPYTKYCRVTWGDVWRVEMRRKWNIYSRD
jgi:hypothetical protein